MATGYINRRVSLTAALASSGTRVISSCSSSPDEPLTNNDCKFDVALLPQSAGPLRETTVVVVDVLRATTTIIAALGNGATCVIPSPSIETAMALHREMGPGSIIGGERKGKIVDGFHQGNSPVEYTPEVATGKTLILATTNGTVAMECCREADAAFIGAMVNVDAVAEKLFRVPKVTVVCSGTDRIITSEDVCFAGLLVQRMNRKRADAGLSMARLTDAAAVALAHWESVEHGTGQGTPLVEVFRQAAGGINLVRIGHDDDIAFAAQIDQFDTVPELDLKSWTIR